MLSFDKMVAKGVDPAYASKLIQYGWETITEALKHGGITGMMDRLDNPSKVCDRRRAHCRRAPPCRGVRGVGPSRALPPVPLALSTRARARVWRAVSGAGRREGGGEASGAECAARGFAVRAAEPRRLARRS